MAWRTRATLSAVVMPVKCRRTARHLDEPDVAGDHDRLALGRNSLESEARRCLAAVHDSAARKIDVLGVVHDQGIEDRAVGKRPAQHVGVHDGIEAVREGDRAGFGKQSEFRELCPFSRPRDGGNGMDLDERGLTCPAFDEMHQRDIVDRGPGGGHACDRGDTAYGSGTARSMDRLLVFEAGLSQVRAKVDEARRRDEARGIDDGAAVRHVFPCDMRAEIRDRLGVGEDAADLVAPACRVDQPCAEIDGLTRLQLLDRDIGDARSHWLCSG